MSGAPPAGRGPALRIIRGSDGQRARDPPPGDAADGPISLVDVGDASANFAAYVLAYLLPACWTRAQRREGRREGRLLRRYLRTSEASGVHGYRWDALRADYRPMIALMIFDPVWNGAAGTAQAHWWPKMQCLTGPSRIGATPPCSAPRARDGVPSR